MSFPDRIERSVEISRPPEDVWSALTTDDGLRSWFGDEATVDLRPGGFVQLRWRDGGTVDMRVECVEPAVLLSVTWLMGGSAEQPSGTSVEFRLEPHEGGTRLTVVESGFAKLPAETREETYDGHVEGWRHELDELVDQLRAPR